MSATWYQWHGEDLVLALHVQPRATADALDGIHGERLKVRLTAAPVEGKANAHLIGFLAQQFGVPRRQIQLLAGGNSRAKRVRIQAPRRLPAAIPPPSA